MISNYLIFIDGPIQTVVILNTILNNKLVKNKCMYFYLKISKFTF